MKSLFDIFLFIILLGLSVSSCNNDKEEPVLPVGNGEVLVQLIINNSNGSHTISRGSTGSIIGSDEESELAGTLYIYVFNEKGVYESSHEVQCVGKVTETFRVTSGIKRLYVFSNPPIGYPFKIHAQESFEMQILTADFTNNIPTIATDYKFFIESLWRETDKIIEHPDTNPAVQSFTLEVGRAVAKVRVKSVQEAPSGSEIKGRFVNPVYTMQSVATRYYLVGQYRGDKPPAADTQVFSAVHEEGPGTLTVPNPVFKDYDFPSSTNIDGMSSFYVIEHTTRKDPQTGTLYYGNTTHVHLKVQYIPDANIVLDGQDGVSQGTIVADQTFWSARDKSGELKIYDSDPSHLDDLVHINHYPQGWCHYYFPVKDPVETDEERRYCVIRNHFYDIGVQLSGLGTPNDKINPETPINDGIDVILSCVVEEWTSVDVNGGKTEL